MYTAKFDAFLFDQISLIKFQKNRTCSIFTITLYHRCSTGFQIRLCSQLYFPIEKEVNRNINSLRTFYAKGTKKNSDIKKRSYFG